MPEPFGNLVAAVGSPTLHAFQALAPITGQVEEHLYLAAIRGLEYKLIGRRFAAPDQGLRDQFMIGVVLAEVDIFGVYPLEMRGRFQGNRTLTVGVIGFGSHGGRTQAGEQQQRKRKTHGALWGAFQARRMPSSVNRHQHRWKRPSWHVRVAHPLQAYPAPPP